MNIIEKQWEHGSYLAYENVEPELLNFKPGARVLPAPYYYEKQLYFELIRIYQPGEKRTFPKGGFEVRGPNPASVYNFELDQVVLHPLVIKHEKAIEKTQRKIEKERLKTDKQREREQRKLEKEQNKGKGKRGRKPLSPEERALREQKKAEGALRSGGKRGRPKMDPALRKTPIKPAGTGTGKRGRPALSAEEKLKRDAIKQQTAQRSGGKRGRPKGTTRRIVR